MKSNFYYQLPKSWACQHSAAVLDGLGELVFDVPGEMDPLRLLELLDESVDDRRARGLGIQRGEVGLRQHLPHRLRRAPGIDQVVDQQVPLARALHAFQDLDGALHLRRAPLIFLRTRVVAGDADGVDQADVELARDQRRRHEAAARHRDDAFPGTLAVQDFGQVARIAMQLYPGDDDFVLVGDDAFHI